MNADLNRANASLCRRKHASGQSVLVFVFLTVSGFFLAANAGFLNAVTVHSTRYTVSISHVTGHITSAANLHADTSRLLFDLLAIICFYLGAVLSGFVTGGTAKFQISHRYGLGLIVEGVLIACAAISMEQSDEEGGSCTACVHIAIALAAMGCGLQNAMTTGYSGAVVRTTHLTGVVTDLGTLTSYVLRGRNREEWWRFQVFIPLVVGYTSGALLGSWAFAGMGFRALWLSAVFCAALGVLYYVLRALLVVGQLTHRGFRAAVGRRETPKHRNEEGQSQGLERDDGMERVRDGWEGDDFVELPVSAKLAKNGSQKGTMVAPSVVRSGAKSDPGSLWTSGTQALLHPPRLHEDVFDSTSFDEAAESD